MGGGVKTAERRLKTVLLCVRLTFPALVSGRGDYA